MTSKNQADRRRRNASSPLLPRYNKGSGARQIGLAIAATLGWFLALASFQGWLDFRKLLNAESQWFRDDVVFVNKEVKLTDSVGMTSSRINSSLLDEIRSLRGVEVAEPILRNHFPASVEIGGGVVPKLVSEIFLEALPGTLFSPDTDGWNWTPGDSLVPVLVPRQFLNLYNFGYAPGKGLPAVSEGVAQRVRFALIAYPARGGPPVSFIASIAGFSDQIESILVPSSFLSWANDRFGREGSGQHDRIAVALSNPDSAEFYTFLKENRLLGSRGTREMARIRMILDLSLAVLGFAGALILCLVLLLSLTEVESLIADHRDRIRKLYFLGHPPGSLLKILVSLRIFSAALPAMVGLGLLWICRLPLEKFLAETGLLLRARPDGLTMTLWITLLLILNLCLIARIRARLIRLYR